MAFPPQRIAQEAENRGFHCIFLPENSHLPINRDKTIKKFDGIKRLSKFYDPFVTLAACAAVTTEIKLGTSVCLLTQRDPIITARVIESLERISNNRLILGVAGGFVREAMENHGSDFNKRWDIVRQRVIKMREIWYHVNEQNRLANRNKNKIDPLIWIGSNSNEVPKRVAEYADGWLARRDVYIGSPPADLRLACEKQGRDLNKITLSLMDPPLSLPDIRKCINDGYRNFVYFISEATKGEVICRLNSISKLIDKLN
jgi:alkanesulfonate monooxygenase SsuD/methylene tetrahydromethanopterin reductase-like flavin-dependent oxidoreductase (luciferase family)